MRAKRKQRIFIIVFIGLSVSSAVFFILYSLKSNINLFLTPTELKQRAISSQEVIRLGGMVLKGSVKRYRNLKIEFILTDYISEVRIQYQGVLPALFREGQGIVTMGHINHQGGFVATEVLAKHDANYMPQAMKQHSYIVEQRI